MFPVALTSSVHARPLHVAAFAALLAAIIVAVAAGGTASAGTKPHHSSAKAGKTRKLIASPHPGQQIRSNYLRLVVKSGPEREDLRAKLNGVAIGERFRVNLKGHRRYLEASLADGLRRGRNTLVVWVKQRDGSYRRAQVKFVVAHRKPLVSAGRDLRIAAGSGLELHGQLSLPQHAAASDVEGEGDWAGPTEVEWNLIAAPARSELEPLTIPLGTIGPAQNELEGLEEADTLSPVFTPDVPGLYKLQMTVSSALGTSRDEATVYAIPASPLVSLDTEVKAGAQPGIRIGSQLLAAPPLSTAGAAGSYSGTIAGIQYKAILQVVVLERSTTALKWNRTYGVCQSAGSGGPYPCRIGEKGAVAESAVGVPVAAKLGEELTALSNESLVIVASHPSSGAGMEWAAPAESKFTEANLAPIGFPKKSDPEIGTRITAAKAGELAAVGVPGLSQGEATITAGAGSAGLVGYLSPDSSRPTPHYGFIAAQRIPFDTRAASECNGSGCSVTQRIGEGPNATEVKGIVPANEGGFLVAGYNRQTLAPIESKTFATAISFEEPEGNNGPARFRLEQMSAYVAALAKKEAIVLITSIHGSQQATKVLYTPGTPSWNKLLGAVASVGGTREELIAGGTTAGADYSLASAGPMAEGEATESSSAGARLRGFLVPDGDSVYRPETVNAVAAPNKLMMNTVLGEPGTQAWPDEDRPEVMAAMSYIGTRTNLGTNPRFSYWSRLTTSDSARDALTAVGEQHFESGHGFKVEAWEAAIADLKKELPLVRTVRTYMEELKSTTGDGTEAWEKALKVNAELKDLLEKLKEKSKASAEVLSIFSQIFQFVATAAGFPEATAFVRFLELAVIAGEAGENYYNVNYDGSEGKPSTEVEAAKLGEELAKQAKASSKSFDRFGDILVSDWSKLQLIGKYGGCDPEGGCGPKGEYAELSYEPKIGEAAQQATTEGFEREIYTKLVPLVFPIWKTEPETAITAANLGEHYYCYDISHPFRGAPELAYFKSPAEFLPAFSEGNQSNNISFQVYLSVARSGRTYGWASKSMLEHMFNPLNARNAKEDGLGMDRGDFMREGERIAKYIPSHNCYWYG
jgi:hypothetical protein